MCTHPDVIDSGLEADILKIPKDISENVGMGNDTQKATLKLSTDGFCTRTCSTSTCLDSC